MVHIVRTRADLRISGGAARITARLRKNAAARSSQAARTGLASPRIGATDHVRAAAML